MNLILLSEDDFVSPTSVRLSDRRFLHIRDIHRTKVGDTLRVGLVGGGIGQGGVVELTGEFVQLDVVFNTPPPQPLPLTLFLALPRPKFLAKILQTTTSLGVKQIYLFNSYRVEKIYWHCEQLQPEEIRRACLLGLEQARDTVLPQIHLRRLFKPFVEDELPGLIKDTQALLAHPTASAVCPRETRGQVSLAIGPEGGFIDYEVEKLTAAGFQPVHTFERILKVEAAVTSLIGRLM